MTKLRIISGSLKGRYVSTGEEANFRPTQERVRESVAEIVKKKILGAAAADLCAGSGAFGFEMLSRGAKSVDFVEADGRLADKIAANAAALGVTEKIKVIRDDVSRFAGTSANRYDVIFYDPPYDVAELQELVPKLLSLLTESGMLIYERRRGRKEKTPDTIGKTNIADVRIYSDTVIEIYKRENNADSALPGNI